MTTSNIRNFYKKYQVHLLVWSLYIIYEVFILAIISKSFRQPGSYVIVYSCNVCAFYFHAFLLTKILNKDNRRLRPLMILLLVLMMICLYVLFSYLLLISFEYFGLIKSMGEGGLNFDFILSCVYRSLLYIGFSTGYVYIRKSFEDQKKVEALQRASLVAQIEKQTLENNLVQSQNNYLRSQINPHFLFNTLNFIYNDARKKAPMAADAIMNLAEMMRYALKRPEASELVPLKEEIEQIEHLINLQKLRTANTINLELDVSNNLFGLRFPPLILLTLIENIFKHGNVTHSTQPAIIKINYEDNILYISTINMVNDNKGKQTESHHVGIENIRQRLTNFYGEDFSFNYYRDPLNRYITELEVKMVNPMLKAAVNH